MEQVVLFNWIRAHLKRYPDLQNAFSVPNGAKLPYKKVRLRSGKEIRVSHEYRKLEEEGLTAGVPDTVMFAARLAPGLADDPLIAPKIKHKKTYMNFYSALSVGGKKLFTGLAVEMKHGTNKPDANQLRWLQTLHLAGVVTAVAYTGDDAIAIYEWYVKLPRVEAVRL